MIRYIELKSGYHDDGPAWIARVAVSKSGRTLYFNGKALKRSTQSGSGNYYDVETTESYWLPTWRRSSRSSMTCFTASSLTQDKLVYVNDVLMGKLLESETLRQQAAN